MSCLFNSLGRLLGQPGPAVRASLVAFMATHLDTVHQGMTFRDWIGWQHEGASVGAYLQAMRHASTWGGAMELAAATQCYHTDIMVVDGRGTKVAEFLWRDACTARRRLVLEWTGVHYEPVRAVDLMGKKRRVGAVG